MPNNGRAIVSILAFLALTACTARGIDPQMAQSPSYQVGYGDGCRTANSRQNGTSSEVTRNEAIYKTNRSYRAGWRAGYGACGGAAGNESTRVFNDDQWLSGPRGL